MIVFLDNNINFEVCEEELNYMKENKIVYENDDLYFVNKFSPFTYLFNTNSYKRRIYITELSKQKFICNVCGKEHSYNISPYITTTGEVDFHKVVCCCSQCRVEKLKNRNIVVPIFKQKIDWEKEREQIKKDIKEYHVTKKYRDSYITTCKNILIFDKYSKLILPLRDFKDMKQFDKEIDLKNLNQRREFKNYLYSLTKGYCPICGHRVAYKNFTIDHIIAKSLGGEDNINNFIGMCEKCNKEKGSKTVLEFLCTKELKKMPTLIVYIAKNQQENAKKQIRILKEKKDKIENRGKHF